MKNIKCPLCKGTLVKMIRIKKGKQQVRYCCSDCRGFSFFPRIEVTVQQGEIWRDE